MQNKFSKLAIVLVVAVVIAAIAGGVFAWQYFAKKTQTPAEVLQSENSDEQVTQVANNETAGWKTYTNDTYNYQIEYVPTAIVEETTGGGLKIKYQKGNIEICHEGVGACGNFPGVGPEAEQVSKQISIDGEKYNVFGFILDGNETLGLDLPNDIRVRINIFPKNSDTESELLQMLSTFKFTTPTGQTSGPKINSISLASGSVGTKIEVFGSDLNGFEGDLNLWIENSSGIKGIIYGETGSTSNMIKFTVPAKVCQTDESYRGLPCASWLELVPGVYKIYAEPWGNKTNEVLFTITK